MSRRLTAYVLIALSLMVCIPAAMLQLNPYSDAQIRSSVVDTWEPEAWVTLVVLGVLGFLGALAILLSLTFKSQERRLTLCSATVSLLCACLVFGSHVAFSIRVTKLT